MAADGVWIDPMSLRCPDLSSCLPTPSTAEGRLYRKLRDRMGTFFVLMLRERRPMHVAYKARYHEGFFPRGEVSCLLLQLLGLLRHRNLPTPM